MKEALMNKRSNVGSIITHFVYNFFCRYGKGYVFFWDSIKSFFKKPYRLKELVQSMEFIGNKSVPVILIAASFMGMALSYQVYLGFKQVGTTSLVGPIIALSIFKELGPVVTGLVVSARAGGAMAAQLGSMRISEQIDALQIMGINPKQYLIAPRLLASFLCTPLLCAVFDFIAIIGAFIFSVNVLNLDGALFLDKIQSWVRLRDLLEGFIKSSIFGFIFSSVCMNRGFNTRQGAKGVGDATNQGVVHSMIYIIIVDFFVTNFLNFFYVLMGLEDL